MLKVDDEDIIDRLLLHHLPSLYTWKNYTLVWEADNMPGTKKKIVRRLIYRDYLYSRTVMAMIVFKHNTSHKAMKSVCFNVRQMVLMRAEKGE